MTFYCCSRSRLRTLSRKTSARHHSLLMICYMFSMRFTIEGVLYTRHLAVDTVNAVRTLEGEYVRLKEARVASREVNILFVHS